MDPTPTNLLECGFAYNPAIIMLLFVCVLIARIARSYWLMTVDVDIIVVIILVRGC